MYKHPILLNLIYLKLFSNKQIIGIVWVKMGYLVQLKSVFSTFIDSLLALVDVFVLALFVGVLCLASAAL